MIDQIQSQKIESLLKRGSRLIAPLWSLENFVAVNPYLNMSGEKFGSAMDFLEKTGGVQATLPIEFYMKAVQSGRISREDLRKSLEDNSFGFTSDVNEFLTALHQNNDYGADFKMQTISDLASDVNGKDWSRFMVDRISFWASAYFDSQQAIWNTSRRTKSPYQDWKREAEVDRSPGLMGLKGFRKFVKRLPEDPLETIAMVLTELDMSDELAEHYLASLLMKMNGWAGFAARIDWDAGLDGKESNILREYIAIMLAWELSIKMLLKYPELSKNWEVFKQKAEVLIPTGKTSQELSKKLILQEAFDISNQRKLTDKLNFQKQKLGRNTNIDVQAIFCIDVRSELFRRNLEAANNRIETLGFAGFFGFPIKYVQTAHDHGVNGCPVLISPSHTVKEEFRKPSDGREILKNITYKARVAKIWKNFKKNAISCFSFVSPLGIFYLPKLITDTLGYTRPKAKPNEFGISREELENKSISLETDIWRDEITGIPLEDRISMAESALKAMSLTENFAPIVLIVGHGSSTVNNPHATGLDCGACGGHSGEANARVAAEVLNDTQVRKELDKRGIEIPDMTIFIAALHDTTTDNISLFYKSMFPSQHHKLLKELKYALNVAGDATRRERAMRMRITNDYNKSIIQRSKDWSQVRPEWGLAGCSSFIVAPRERTEHVNLAGKSFLHNYNWKKDKDFAVLETIMTAPMVVTSWINLQYYASTVDNKKFGSGNKTLHNIVGGIGVLEGFGGDLKVGLPWQSVNDGFNFQHEPQRLNVIIEAPVDEMSKILDKHESIRNLCDNHWIFLFAMNDEGKVAYKYIGDLQWEVYNG